MSSAQESHHVCSACPRPPSGREWIQQRQLPSEDINLSTGQPLAENCDDVTLGSESLGSTIQENSSYISPQVFARCTVWVSGYCICLLTYNVYMLLSVCVYVCLCTDRMRNSACFCGCRQFWDSMICLGFHVGWNCLFFNFTVCGQYTV